MSNETTDYDSAAYHRGTKQERLRIIQDARLASTDERQNAFFEGMMLADSTGLPEHPEWLQFGCNCDSCLSYL